MPLTDLTAYAEKTQSQLGNCPTAVVASAGDRILLETYSSGPDAVCGEVTPDSLWQLASATKTYISALLLNLSYKSILDLDDPVVRHLPDFCKKGDNAFDRELATVRHLATHTSGVHIEPPEDKAIEPDLSLARIVDEPGKVFTYAWTGMHTLQRLIEAATGERFPDVLYQHILDPLGLSQSRYYYDYDPTLPMLSWDPIDPADPKKSFVLAERGLHPHYGLFVTAREANRFGQLWLGDGEFEGRRYFTPGLKEAATAHYTTRPSDNGKYGLLLWLFDEVDGIVISGAGSKVVAISPKTGGVVTVLRLPQKPTDPEYSFYHDKVELLKFAEQIGRETSRT
jgi:CubicO group peptidase (beta-lactamase class C family)